MLEGENGLLMPALKVFSESIKYLRGPLENHLHCKQVIYGLQASDVDLGSDRASYLDGSSKAVHARSCQSCMYINILCCSIIKSFPADVYLYCLV
jgi:hypothetical protein